MNTFISTLSKKTIFYVIFLIIFFSILFYISGIISVLSSILNLIIFSFITFFLYFIWKKIRKKEKLDYIGFLDYFLYKVSIWIIILITLIGSFAYYENEISPSIIPSFTITNGKKTVIFQAMSHIGSKEFYESIKQDLINAKKQGFVYYYEGVKGGTKQNEQDFNKALGIKFDHNLYKNLSKLYGVTHQDDSMYYNLINDKDYNVDLTTDEIMEYYNKLKKKPLNKDTSKNKKVVDIKEVTKTLSTLNEKELKILIYINKGLSNFLNFLISNKTTRDLLINNLIDKDLFKIILDKRNKVLSEKIIYSNHNKIYITYGLLHFDGVLKLLQKNDKNWKIIKVKNLYPIQ